MRLFIVYLWNYIRVLLYGKLFKKEVGGSTPPVKKPSNKLLDTKPYLTYRSNSVGLSNTPSHKKRIKNRNNRKRRHKKWELWSSQEGMGA